VLDQFCEEKHISKIHLQNLERLLLLLDAYPALAMLLKEVSYSNQQSFLTFFNDVPFGQYFVL